MNCIIKEFNFNDLNSLHTKQLLKLRSGGMGALRFHESYANCAENCENGQECLKIIKMNREKVLKILGTREHVLNKQESKLRRKERIKRGK